MTDLPLTTIEAVDAVFLYIFGISGLLLLGITATMVVFVIRYHRRRHPQPQPSPSSKLWLELVWTLIPTLIVLSMFWYSWEGYLKLSDVPPDALKVQAEGRKWSWSFNYQNGRSSDRLYVPLGQAVRVEIISKDVLHSLYIPAFRVKKDAVPGLNTYVWFRAPEVGSFDLYCAEYCGVSHSSMITTVEVLPQEQFDAWLKQGAKVAPDEGPALLTRHGCSGCHSLDGSQRVGPTFQGLFGRQVQVTSKGQEQKLIADRDYIQRSILDAQADLVVGYPPVMPSYQEQIPEDELQSMVDYLCSEVLSIAPEKP
ncbi:cytochrome c oxidase subunit II [Syntrophotalea acetylenivorans]|uniref:Cytochrome c oxidase subunit 2 n=1 Tax=Syntrophotalea acetylenivorans TaxID=1842532 RepID=A0A1L3GS81_9BACT|nr:cytochrome c oxidase subunit II [Syntrophotalea acetylenivorans]APG28720.1 cytochrome c oxidase subunit II [Syntrophotalea acetylenivorans]